MTSDHKTTAYLARRVAKVEELQIENQELARIAMETLTCMKAHLSRNEEDHKRILKHLGIE